MSDSFPCLTCGKTWSGHRRCHCGTCHQNFSSVSAFDVHRRNFKCRPLAETKLVPVSGYWSFPGERPALLCVRVQDVTQAAA